VGYSLPPVLAEGNAIALAPLPREAAPHFLHTLSLSLALAYSPSFPTGPRVLSPSYEREYGRGGEY
jgi:hypothetical protein